MSGWSVYILRCADDTLYTGIAPDVQKRLVKHNAGKGAKYTRGRGPVTLVYQAEFPNRAEASKEEYRIKHLSRPEKLLLIEGK